MKPLGRFQVLAMVVAALLVWPALSSPTMAWAEAEEEEAAPSERHNTFLFLGVPVETDYEIIGGDIVVGGDMVFDPSWAIEPHAGKIYGFSQDDGFWPEGVVPYAIHTSIRGTHRSHIQTAIDEFEKKTAIRWVPRQGQEAFVQFIELDGGPCRAEPGFTGGRRRVKLRDNGICNLGVVTHEMGHTLGLLHEQNRSDAKSYVQNLSGCLDGTGSHEVGPFDICSTMLYRSTTLGSCNIKLKPGTTSADCPNAEQCPGSSACALLHDWGTLSQGDVATINKLYSPDPDPDPDPDPEPPPSNEDPPEPPPSGDSLVGGCHLGSPGAPTLASLFLLLVLPVLLRPRRSCGQATQSLAHRWCSRAHFVAAKQQEIRVTTCLHTSDEVALVMHCSLPKMTSNIKMTKTLATILTLGSTLAIGCASPDSDIIGPSNDKADQISGADDPSGLLGTAERRLASLVSDSDVGQSFGVPDEKAPYPDTYWPMGGDDIAPDGNGIAVEWVNNDGTTCFTRNDCADAAPSPLAKYMALVNPDDTQEAIEWETKNHGTEREGVLSWFGHCPGWVASTLLHLPVTEPLSVSFDGAQFVPCTRGSECMKFEIGDINALSAEIHEGARSLFIGARCDTEFEEDLADDSIDIDGLRDEFGRIVRNGSGCKGLNAGAMLILMGNRLKNDQKPFAIDAQNEFNTEQIWNQPAYRYTVNRFRPLTKSQATHLVASGGESETASSLSGDEYIFNENARGFAFIDFGLHWVTETAPNVTVVSGVDSTRITRMVAVIELDRDASDPDAEIIGGEYIDDESVGANRLRVAPFAWIATDAAPENGTRKNPFVSPALVKQLLAMTDEASAGNDGGAPTGCSHELCSQGEPLSASCDSVVADVCAADAFCCDNRWDSVCVDEVTSIGGLSCN